MNHRCAMLLVLRYFLMLAAIKFGESVTTTTKRPHKRDNHTYELPIDSGAIRGKKLKLDGKEYVIFKGIPYAASPVGALRFQMPEEPPRWVGVMNATNYKAMCPQKVRDRQTDPAKMPDVGYDEDCLYLNVFGPLPHESPETFPVIVWIHGGDFQSGSGSDYSQLAILRNFVSRNIIFITFNYRLGPLGFMSTGDDVIPGNNGLWDQIHVLKWVQRNIQEFCGNTSYVTLAGHGSGAASASILALSPRAEGLFHRLLLMSGTALTPGMVRDSAVNATWNLDRDLHCRSFNSTELIQCFRKHLKEEIINNVAYNSGDYPEFVPRVDGKGGVIPDPIETLALYRPKIPLMIGTTLDESTLKLVILNEKNLNQSGLTKKTAEGLAENLTTSFTGFKNTQLITRGCMHEYVWKNVDPANDVYVLYDSILKMFSHFWYDAPASRLASYYARDVPVYLYSFDHTSENLDWDKAFHGCDQIYLFDIVPKFIYSRMHRKSWQVDRHLTEIFAGLIVNFAVYEDPTPESAGLSFNWTTMDPDVLNYLSITEMPMMNVGFRWRGHIFWNSYAKDLDGVDVGNLERIASLERKLGYFQLATWTLLVSALFFFTILVGLACYCTRKDNEEEEL